MPRFPFLPAAALVFGGVLTPVAAAPDAAAPAPIKNFRLPLFTDAGHRQLMIRAGEASLPDRAARIEALELELTLFTGRADEQIEAMLATPAATLIPEKLFASGPSTVRLERADLTLTGADWSYDHRTRTIIIQRDAHVVFRSAVGDLLK